MNLQNIPIFEMILDNPSESPAVEAKPSVFSEARSWTEDHQEGQLAIDVLETDKDMVVISTMSGADEGKIEVYIHNDLLTIRGARRHPLDGCEIKSYFYSECFWGGFSRTIVLPVDVKADLARAEYRNGILLIQIPKQRMEARIPVEIVEE